VHEEGGCLRISGSRLKHPNIPLPWKGVAPSPNFLEVRAVLKLPWSARLAKGSKVFDALKRETDRCKPSVEPRQGSLPMSLEQNKLGGESQNQTGILETVSRLEDFARSNIPADSLGERTRRTRRGEEKTLDRVFRGLLEEANRELASLLRDVRAGSDTALLDSAESGVIRDLLRRALQCATKQYMVQMELSNLALKDELTGLYNRRGFLALADRQLKLARRSGRSLLLFFIDLDGLKEINDVFGHTEGDAALKWTAEALLATFRDSDVVARLGGDEFAALAIEASGQSEVSIRERLTEYLRSVSGGDTRHKFSVSLGTARFDPLHPVSIRELIAEADRAMYEQKQKRRRSSLRLSNDPDISPRKRTCAFTSCSRETR
jgi:diguanylate cyclase (GGDEF)-like protein